ncbi:MAG: SDR family oxidoreductase [Bacteroidia bacterium]
MIDFSLKGKRAIVCGSTQGIGKATAIALADLGCNVTLFARNEDSLKKVKNELATSDGQSHSYVCVDFTDLSNLQKLVDAFIQRNGPVHILVNNTGGPAAGPVHKAKKEEFLGAFNQHLIANHILTQSCLEGMKTSHYGRIINIISTSVKAPLPNLGVSNTIRAAVANWSKTMANELAEFGITVNNVLPGATNTQRLQSIIENKSSKQNVNKEDVSLEMKNEIPMKRFGEASEIANAVAFLAGPAASYITGINLPVDGGRTGCL